VKSTEKLQKRGIFNGPKLSFDRIQDLIEIEEKY
jgi:hypothetical protein